ncbi:unnamed protein product [Rhizophagus irregularis]|nr:unnamed protein product [Rhizophagus irregularis]
MFRRAQAWCPDAIRTGYNKAFKRVKLNYPKSYRARHALSVIHDNNGFVELQRTVRTAGNLVDFSDQDEKILFNNWKQRKQKREYVNGLCALCGYLRKHNLSNHIPNVQYHEQSTSKSSTESMEFSKEWENQQQCCMLPPLVQVKIFAEIASGLIRILFVTPEKYIANSQFRVMLSVPKGSNQVGFEDIFELDPTIKINPHKYPG